MVSVGEERNESCSTSCSTSCSSSRESVLVVVFRDTGAEYSVGESSYGRIVPFQWWLNGCAVL